MSFINRIIPSKKIFIIDVGTYKVKVALCEYKNNEINIIDYAEKRQEPDYIIGSEIANIEGVSDIIEKTIGMIVKGKKYNPSDIVINVPTSTIVSSGKNLDYIRKQKDEIIDIDELDIIVGKIEREALEVSKKEIANKTGYIDLDMKLITSSITNVSIDNYRVSNPIGFTGKNISLSLLNIFIPVSRYNIINTIAESLGKKIISIIPLEFSLPRILLYTDYVFDDLIYIDIGNTKTSIILQKNGVIMGFDRLSIGMSDLVKMVKTNTQEANIEIIKNISKNDTYLTEKEIFFDVWKEGFLIVLKELVKKGVVPHKIFISGGGDNLFFRKKISDLDINKYGIHKMRPFSFIEIDLEKDININGSKKFFNKTNIGLLSMILTTKEIIQYKNNPLVSIIKNFLEKNDIL